MLLCHLTMDSFSATSRFPYQGCSFSLHSFRCIVRIGRVSAKKHAAKNKIINKFRVSRTSQNITKPTETEKIILSHGEFFDKYLTFEDHIQRKVNKANSLAGLL